MTLAMAPEFILRDVAAKLASYRYMFASEVQLHEGLAAVLAKHGIAHEREKILDSRNRVDFWLIELAMVIEVKVDGSLGEAARQVGRYCALGAVQGVLLASTKPWARQPLKTRPTLSGKAFHMVHLKRQSL